MPLVYRIFIIISIDIFHINIILVTHLSRSGGMADAPDSKSGSRKGVRVRAPPSVPFEISKST